MNCKKFSNLLSDEEKFGFVIASLGHDLDHEGKNNNYLINTQHKLAVLYNDKSPLENHHCAILFKLLGDNAKNIFENMDQSEFKGVRTMMIENILSTDMKVHFSMLADFKKELLEDPNFGSDGSEEKKLKISNMFIHTADLSGSTKDIKIAAKWTERVNQEFADQYESEIEKEIPLTPYFANLDSNEVFYKSEASFLKFIVTPLYELANMFEQGQLGDIFNILQSNQKHYEDKL